MFVDRVYFLHHAFHQVLVGHHFLRQHERLGQQANRAVNQIPPLLLNAVRVSQAIQFKQALHEFGHKRRRRLARLTRYEFPHNPNGVHLELGLHRHGAAAFAHAPLLFHAAQVLKLHDPFQPVRRLQAVFGVFRDVECEFVDGDVELLRIAGEEHGRHVRHVGRLQLVGHGGAVKVGLLNLDALQPVFFFGVAQHARNFGKEGANARVVAHAQLVPDVAVGHDFLEGVVPQLQIHAQLGIGQVDVLAKTREDDVPQLLVVPGAHEFGSPVAGLLYFPVF